MTINFITIELDPLTEYDLYLEYTYFVLDYVTDEGSTLGMWSFEEWLIYQLFEVIV